MGERGKISETPLGPVFKEVALGNKDGVFYLKGPDRENVFAIIENGRTRHVSGDLGEGDPALIGCFSWSEGSYNFIEDIEADEKAFANNVSDELADILKKGVKSYDELTKNLAGHIETEVLDSAPTTRRPKRLTKPAVVFFGGLYTKLCYDTGKSVDEISKLAVPDVFTGIIAALTSQSIGYMFFIGGKKLGEAAINDDGITACEGAATGLFEEAVQIEAYKYPEGIMPPYIALANGARAIARVSATAVNIDKFVPWAEEKELTCFIWINDNRHTANILIKKGKILGGLTELSSDLNPVIDDALAIFYSVGAEVEIFSV